MENTSKDNKTTPKVKLAKVDKKGILQKLLAFQSLGIVVEKDGVNPHFKSKYATLNEVLAKIKAPLNAMGVLVLQLPERDGLRTKLIDTEDGSLVEAFLPYVEIGTAQKLGSNNTYNRRYSLVTLLGLEDEDDDGHETSRPLAPARSLVPAKPVVVATKVVAKPAPITNDDLDDIIG